MDLKQCMEEAGLSTYGLAKELKTDQMSVWRWANKQVIPGKAWAQKLQARFPELDMNEFYR